MLRRARRRAWRWLGGGAPASLLLDLLRLCFEEIQANRLSWHSISMSHARADGIMPREVVPPKIPRIFTRVD